jgi:hypothetical protein
MRDGWLIGGLDFQMQEYIWVALYLEKSSRSESINM